MENPLSCPGAPRVCVRKPDTNVVWNLTDVKAARAPDYLRQLPLFNELPSRAVNRFCGLAASSNANVQTKMLP